MFDIIAPPLLAARGSRRDIVRRLYKVQMQQHQSVRTGTSLKAARAILWSVALTDMPLGKFTVCCDGLSPQQLERVAALMLQVEAVACPQAAQYRRDELARRGMPPLATGPLQQGISAEHLLSVAEEAKLVPAECLAALRAVLQALQASARISSRGSTTEAWEAAHMRHPRAHNTK